MNCGTPEPGETMEAMLERKQADGSITVDDADTVREFADFLQEMGPSRGPERDGSRQRQALIKYADLCGLSEQDVAVLQQIEDRYQADAEPHAFEASDPDEDDAPADTCRQCGVLQGDHR